MELEEKGDVSEERRGRQLYGRVVGREAKTEGNDNGRKGRIRRATIHDLNAIMDINDNVYLGLDYLPELFNVYMQSKLHVLYVYEEDGRLVSFVNFRFHLDCDDLVSVLAGRVRASYEGRGLGISTRSLVFKHLLKEYPNITRCVGDKLCVPRVLAKVHEMNVNYHWNTVRYKLDDRQWLNRFTRIRQMTYRANQPFHLSYTNAMEWLERSDQLVQFLSKYVTNLFPCGSDWTPTPANKSGLREMLLGSNVYISMDMIPTIDKNYPSDLISVGESGPQRTRDRGQEGDVIGLSHSNGLSCKYGMRIDIFFYGDSEKVFLSHIYSHLLHYINISPDDVRIGIVLHFPQTINSRNVEELLKDEMGERIHEVGATQAVQFLDDIPRAKL